MLKKINEIQAQINEFKITDHITLELFRNKFLSKKGVISQLFNDFKFVSSEDKKVFGNTLNTLKNLAQSKFESFSGTLSSSKQTFKDDDYSLSSDSLNLGSQHPITSSILEISRIFNKIGFSVSTGPQIEDDWHVFTGLAFPDEHPARDMQDTFFFNKDPDILLRTHTSSVQVRVMENIAPPIRQIFPGKVFRNEAISARSHCYFHQIEGLFIDKNVSFSDLKQTLLFFSKEFFGLDTKIRLRPSFFPFTEPSAEMDISCSICKGVGCAICKYTGYVEILGCGMVDPSVLKLSKIDSKKYSGFAFGMGIERTTMLRYHINDIRYFSDNDIRFLKQF